MNAANFLGNSGNKFFVICENGDAWQCWNSAQKNDYSDSGFLGNFYKKTFTIKNETEKCKFKKCNYGIAKLLRIYN